MADLTRADRAYLSRRKCGLCDAPLWPMQCSVLSVRPPGTQLCHPNAMADRARRCLAERKRKKEASPT